MNTVIDSGATDHCFVRGDIFADYVTFTKLISGRTAGRGTTFEIASHSTIRMQIEVNKREVDLVLRNVLHMPGL